MRSAVRSSTTFPICTLRPDMNLAILIDAPLYPLSSILYTLFATMPLVPLFDTSATPDASHRVTAPGGYESWRTIAYDQKQDVFLLSTRHEGALSDPAYIKAVRRYLRHPTRTLPPLPQNFVCHETALYSRGRPVLRSF